MGQQFDMFKRNSYPDVPGWKGTETSEQAAKTVDAKTLRAAAMGVIQDRPSTADEVAAALGESVLSIRPRMSELKKKELIQDTGLRRSNASGKSAIVWDVK